MGFFSSFFKSNGTEKKFKEAIRNIFGYTPRNIAIYQLALRHRSVSNPVENGRVNCNERLEYLGDAVLGVVVAEFLYKKFPFKGEGFLTELRSRIVSRANLNSLSKKLGIEMLVLSNHAHRIVNTSIVGDAFEALIGAMFFDKGYDFTRDVIINRIISCHVDVDKMLNCEVNFKSRILEWAQKDKKAVDFKVVNEEEPSKNHRFFMVELFIDGILEGTGGDYSIKKAEQKAARQVWEIMQNNQE